jgi:hypothetical protein
MRIAQKSELLRLEMANICGRVSERRGKEKRHCLPAKMIFPVSVPADGQQVLRDLEQIPHVKWLPFDEHDERLKAALAG